jgi:hypothetical protein
MVDELLLVGGGYGNYETVDIGHVSSFEWRGTSALV